MKKIIVIFSLLFISILVSCEKVSLDSEGVILSTFEIIYADGDSADSVKENIVLPRGNKNYYGAVVEWESSNENIITTSGLVTRPIGVDVNVVLTISISYENKTYSEKRSVKVIGTEDTSGLDYGDVFNSLVITYASGDSRESVSRNFSFNELSSTYAKYGITITYSSLNDSNTNPILRFENNVGIISRPLDENKNVIILITLRRGSYVEYEHREIIVIKGKDHSDITTVEDLYLLDQDEEVTVRAVFVDQSRSDYFWITDEVRGILVVDDNNLFAGIPLYTEVIIDGLIGNFAQVGTNLLYAVEVEAVESTITIHENIITDFSTANLEKNVNNRVSFTGFKLVTAPKVPGPFNITKGAVSIGVYVETSCPDVLDVTAYFATLKAGTDVDIINAILTFYNGAPEIYVSRVDQISTKSLTTLEKLTSVENNLLATYNNKIVINNFKLLTESSYNSTISYTYSSSYITIDASGNVVVTRPSEVEGDKEVVVSYLIQIGTDSKSGTFKLIIKANTNSSLTVLHQFSFDNFQFPMVPGQTYREAYQENFALQMLDVASNTVTVYKNRWQLLAPRFGSNLSAAFAPRQGASGELRFDFSTTTKRVSRITFDAGKYSSCSIDSAVVLAYIGTSWVTYNFLSSVLEESYGTIEIDFPSSTDKITILIGDSSNPNDNSQRIYIDNLILFS
ncbi:MAG: hypothetical protein LBV58_00190 [Acholeplasmatales bacterium]|jgi:hypothetical protein|nr:hypothetical protein [Acholeplasmatales bacterium]